MAADMKNMWDVIHRLIDGEPMTEAEQGVAHALTDVHLAQHGGIARQIGEHDYDLKVLKGQAN